MSEQNKIPHTRFDGLWNLRATTEAAGGLTADTETIAAAQLILIRDELRAMASCIRQITHFFHALGTERCRLIVQEAGHRASRGRRARLKKAKP